MAADERDHNDEKGWIVVLLGLLLTSPAATNPNDARSDFGLWVDVAAPGLKIFSTLPTGANASRQQRYGTLSGTPQAAAFVAGPAGLVWSTAWGSSTASVRARIEGTCDRVAGTGTQWAAGRINATRAVGALS